ncbi:TPA: hypothetical protein ACF21L_004914, partial [Escherichia coli]
REFFSSQSHQLKAGKHKKARLPVGVFLCLSFGCTSVFSPSFEGFFFHFLLRSILLIALANRTMPLPTLS